MKRVLMIVAVFAALSMMVSQANAEVQVNLGGSSRRGDTVISVSLSFDPSPPIYRAARVYYRPSVRPHPRPSPQLRGLSWRRRRRATYRPSAYFLYPGPGGNRVRYYGAQAYRHGPYVYVPMKSWYGVHRYRRIYVGH